MDSTSEIVEINGISARVWEGETTSGVKVQVLVTRIAVHKSEDASQFETELREQRAPSAVGRAFPARLIL